MCPVPHHRPLWPLSRTDKAGWLASSRRYIPLLTCVMSACPHPCPQGLLNDAAVLKLSGLGLHFFSLPLAGYPELVSRWAAEIGVQLLRVCWQSLLALLPLASRQCTAMLAVASPLRAGLHCSGPPRAGQQRADLQQEAAS